MNAVLRRRGAAEAGAIFVKIDHLDGSATVYGPAPQSILVEQEPVDDRTFTRAHREGRIGSDKADERHAREVEFDPDLWIIEVEGPEAPAWLNLAA